jgi:hypothetical protein
MSFAAGLSRLISDMSRETRRDAMKSKALRLVILAVVLATAAQLPKETEAQKVQRR